MIDTVNKTKSLTSVMFYALGLFLSMQIISFAGFVMSTYLTVICIFILLIDNLGKLRIRNKPGSLILMFTVSISITTLLALSFNHLLPGYPLIATKSYVQYMLLILFFILLNKSDVENNSSRFFQGFDKACTIHFFWCIAQIVLHRFIHIDLNKLVFNDVLHMTDITSQYKNNILVPTGLHWHIGGIIPVFIYLYLIKGGLFWKIATLSLALYSQAATLIIAMALCVFVDSVNFLYKREFQISKFKLLLFFAGVLIAISFFPEIKELIGDRVGMFMQRIYQIWNPSYGNESSAVHAGYYFSLPKIFKQTPILLILFGQGGGCSGNAFTLFNGQYSDICWVVESDIVDLLLSFGIIGFAIYYSCLVSIVKKWWQHKESRIYAIYIIILMMCGIFYNTQYLWVIILEMMIYIRMQSNIETSARKEIER